MLLNTSVVFEGCSCGPSRILVCMCGCLKFCNFAACCTYATEVMTAVVHNLDTDYNFIPQNVLKIKTVIAVLTFFTSVFKNTYRRETSLVAWERG